MELDVLIPASPTPEFYSQIAMFRVALDSLGSSYRSARLVAVFGATERSKVPDKWRPHFDRIDVEWASCDEYKRIGYRAQADRRYGLIRDAADLVLLCDADTLPTRPFLDELKTLIGQEAVAGVIAHYHFPWKKTSGDPIRDWQLMAQSVLGREIGISHRYTLADPRRDRPECPFYINLGVLASTPSTLRQLHETSTPIRERVRAQLGNDFDAQIGLALAMEESQIPGVALSMRYNFPNDPIAERFYPEELANIRILHYLRRDLFQRERIFRSETDFVEFLNLDLTGSNAILREFVASITGAHYPFAATELAEAAR